MLQTGTCWGAALLHQKLITVAMAVYPKVCLSESLCLSQNCRHRTDKAKWRQRQQGVVHIPDL